MAVPSSRNAVEILHQAYHTTMYRHCAGSVSVSMSNAASASVGSSRLHRACSSGSDHRFAVGRSPSRTRLSVSRVGETTVTHPATLLAARSDGVIRMRVYLF
jgi:hypothetical protein